jgi:asparagine synthase (glutamine-hydrolysing)
MCAICGIYNFDRERSVDEGDITAMRETMIHRGPDDAGNFVQGHVGLGHRRLSIVDLAGGHQPMTNEDGSIWVVFNGEIYNHADFRSELRAKGHVLRTSCDTEAIVHLYEEEGLDAFCRMIGMFAIGIYDTRHDRLILVRDRMGIKPLYYRVTRDALVFASEIKAILAAPGVRAEVNWPRVPDLLVYGSVYGEETLFADIKELAPGHVLCVERGAVTIRKFWDLPNEPLEPGRHEDEREHVRELLRRSVRRRLMSDVPLGAFLSGGVDSSLIVAMMSELTRQPVKTFSIGFAENGYNEFQYSRLVAERFRTDHEEITLDATRFFDALPRLIWHHDEPVALAASVPLYFLSRATKGKATVILTGEGADEVFLGYEQYRWSLKHANIAGAFQRLCPRFAHDVVAHGAQRLFGVDRLLLHRLTMTPGQIAQSFNQISQPSVVRDLLAIPDAGIALARRLDVSAGYFDAAPGDQDFLRRTSYMDFKTFLITLLMKQDKMSMAASIESRVPFLDHELVEYGYRLRTDRKLTGEVGKKIVKDIAADYLPRELIDRQKRGFPVPIVPWLEAPATRGRFEDILLDRKTLARDIIKGDVLESYRRRVPVVQRRARRGVSELVWNLVNLELWQREFIDGSASRPIGRPEPAVIHVRSA